MIVKIPIKENEEFVIFVKIFSKFFALHFFVEADRGLWISETLSQVGKSLTPTNNFSPFNHFYTNDFLFCVNLENIL